MQTQCFCSFCSIFGCFFFKLFFLFRWKNNTTCLFFLKERREKRSCSAITCIQATNCNTQIAIHVLLLFFAFLLISWPTSITNIIIAIQKRKLCYKLQCSKPFPKRHGTDDGKKKNKKCLSKQTEKITFKEKKIEKSMLNTQPVYQKNIISEYSFKNEFVQFCCNFIFRSP